MADHPHRRLSLAGLRRKDRTRTIYQSKTQRPRWVLHMQAVFWRTLMNLGMFFHRMAPPRPPKPNFLRTIASTISGKPGVIILHFFVPKDYDSQKALAIQTPQGDSRLGREPQSSGKGTAHDGGPLSDMEHRLRRRSAPTSRWGGYPVIINFHGGGFTLGTATDDARWCGTVVDECNAIVVSVDYRLAPEHPFPTAVEDGADAVLWIHQHADELGIDREKIALSGFSSGANMAFTVPLRLYDHQTGFALGEIAHPTNHSADEVTLHDQGLIEELPTSSTSNLIDPQPPRTADSTWSAASTTVQSEYPPGPGKPRKAPDSSIREIPVPEVQIKCIIPWYPSLDYTRTREERRATCIRADQELPALFTDLFDDSYLHPPRAVSLDSPYLSPGVAPTALLQAALPNEIIMHTCEWDMLLDEGQAFYERLTSPEIGKKVTYKMIEGVPHGWDKAPNPFKPTPGVREHYLRACREMRRILGDTGIKERKTNEGWSAAPRGSVQIVR